MVSIGWFEVSQVIGMCLNPGFDGDDNFTAGGTAMFDSEMLDTRLDGFVDDERHPWGFGGHWCSL
jgi:hypothetical protein